MVFLGAVRHFFFCLSLSVLKALFGFFAFVMILTHGAFVNEVKAAEDTPFFAGVWELDDGKKLRPLVMSDWLIFDGKMPRIWLYMRQGSVPGSSYQFYARNVGVNGLSRARVDVALIDESHMAYQLSADGAILEKGTARRLSIPNADGSCLAVDTQMKDLLGRWQVVGSEKGKDMVVVSESELTMNKQKQAIETRMLRTGQMAIMTNGAPFAMLTDAGGDYAVLQIVQPGTAAFSGGPIGHLVSFEREMVLRKPKGRCDAAIAKRLKFMGKPIKRKAKQAKAKN
ncbi:MAG: hypothetical protein OIF54_10690 [Cohaesibacter sp.]|nr:hypothetical protein [Cohaesibacter sp.]